MRCLGTFLLLIAAFCSDVVAQEIEKVKLIGVWKLEQSGFIEDGTEVIKNFNPCRLLRNFVFKSDNTVDYTYYEGDLDTCYVGDVETYKWKLNSDTLEVESRGYWGYYLLEMKGENELRMHAIDSVKVSTGDAVLDKMLNTLHFDVYQRRSQPVSCEQCRVVLKLK